MKKFPSLSVFIYAGAAILALAPNLYVISGVYSGKIAPQDNFSPALFTSSDPPAVSALDADRLFPLLREKGLPVGEVTVHPADGARGLAIFIPQNHRYPGSDVNDPRNDSAEAAQGQIYEIMDYLHESYGFDLVLVEGEIAGPVPPEKIGVLAEKISLRERFVRQSEEIGRELERGSPNPGFSDNFAASTGEFIASLDRGIILAGAPYKLKAEGEDIKMFGAEYADTRTECVKIVGDYIHQTERLEQLKTSGSRPSSGTMAQSGQPDTTAGKILEALESRIEELKKRMLENGGGALSLNSADAGTAGSSSLSAMADLPLSGNMTLSGLSGLLSSLRDPLAVLEKNLAVLERWSREKNNNGLLRAVREAKGTLAAMNDLESGKTGAISRAVPPAASGPAYDRAVLTASSAVLPAGNPYLSVNDPEELESMLDRTNALIEEKVIKQRNEDAAQIFSDTLTAENAGAGIIQFGAGHEAGLIEELVARNITVIVIKSDEVLRREKADAEIFRPGI